MRRTGLPLLVIPAEAGIQRYKHINIHHLLDSRLRGNDGIGFAEANREHGIFIRRKKSNYAHGATKSTERLSLSFGSST
jgi:hypothetical protein